MRIILSPAKKMIVDTDSFSPLALPQFLPQAQRLLAAMQTLSDEQLQTLWNCSDALARPNTERLRKADLCRSLTPAVLAYEGLAYRHMAPAVFDRGQFAYIAEHLRILSGFYGLLRPFDGVTPYRLEMQAPLAVDGCKNLYEFWGGLPAGQLAAETDLVLNLASKEYSRAVKPHLPGSVRFLTCTFGQLQKGRVIEKGTLCKMARGEMVRWLAEQKITDPAKITEFEGLGYRFSPACSAEDNFVFIK